jgi:hypothetical protein
MQFLLTPGGGALADDRASRARSVGHPCADRVAEDVAHANARSHALDIVVQPDRR